MKNSRKLIHLPELSLSYDFLQKYLKKTYNIDVKMQENTDEIAKKTASPNGYRFISFGKQGSLFEKNLRKNNVKIITTPDPDIKGYVIIHVAESDIDKARSVISGKTIAAKGKDLKKINAAYYNWGEYSNDEQIDLNDFPTVLLSKEQLLGFSIRPEDQNKFFYANEDDIDEDDDGTAIKHAYATSEMQDRQLSDGGETTKSEEITLSKNKTDERLKLINEMLFEADTIDEDAARELKADVINITDETDKTDKNSSESQQLWVIDQLIEFNQLSLKINDFISRAKALGWTGEYAEKGKWFKEAVEEKAPYELGGWKKTLPAKIRRSRAISSRDRKLSDHKKYISAGRALQALANVTKDAGTKRIAKQDADYFFAEAAKAENGTHINDKQVAKTILEQLGGANRLIAMTGAYNFIAIPKGLSFRIKNASANYIKITLSGLDLYDLEVGRIRGEKYTVVDKQIGLYNDMLKPAIEKATGMYLSLGTLGKKEDGGAVTTDPEINTEIKFKKVYQSGNASFYQATDGEITVPYSITRIRDKKGILLRVENSKTGPFETYSMDEIYTKIKNVFTSLE